MNTGRLIGIVGLGVVVSSVGMAHGEDVREAVEKHVSPLVEAELVPGGVVGVIRGDERWVVPFGRLSYEGDGGPTDETLYEIGSVSKVMTGVLFADAVRRGEVEKGTLVDALMPDGMDAKDFRGVEVELWHLTTHMSGWPTSPINLRPTDPDRPFFGYTEEKLWEYVSQASPQRTPGESFEYSNLGVGLLGTLISRQAGSSYEALTTERVFGPLGMEDIQITLDDEERGRLAPGTSEGRPRKAWGTMGPLDPAGMWVASVPTMLDFVDANLNGGEGEIYESLEMARESLVETPMGHGCFGWMLAHDGATYWHNGMTYGYSAYLAVNHELDLGLVILTNGGTLATTGVGELLLNELGGHAMDPIDLMSKDPVDEDRASALVGVYESVYFELEVTLVRGDLHAKVSGQNVLGLMKTDDPDRFRYAAVDAALVFGDFDEDGVAQSVTLHQGAQVIRCERKGE